MRQIREQYPNATESERVAFDAGVESVLYIRCYQHRATPMLNNTEAAIGECGQCAVDAVEGVITAVIVAIGGEVEGQPTSRVNFLQRVRELVKSEQEQRKTILDLYARYRTLDQKGELVEIDPTDEYYILHPERDNRAKRRDYRGREVCGDASHKGHGQAGCLDCAESGTSLSEGAKALDVTARRDGQEVCGMPRFRDRQFDDGWGSICYQPKGHRPPHIFECGGSDDDPFIKSSVSEAIDRDTARGLWDKPNADNEENDD